MAIAQYFEDFRLGDKLLSDFNGVIYNREDGHNISISPTMTHTTEKLPNRDGELYFGSTVDARTIEIAVYFDDEVDLQELSGWICKKDKQTFQFVDDDKEIDVVYYGNLSMMAYYNNPFQGLMNLTFIAYDPYFRATNEKDISIKSPILNLAHNVKTKGNTDSYPLLKVTPNGTQSKARFYVNDMLVVLQNVNKTIYLDCETEEVYEMNLGQKISARQKYYSTDYYEFPILKPFAQNKIIVIEGSITIDVTPRSRIL